MGLFRRKSKWQRAVDSIDPKVAGRSGASVVAGAVAMTVASAAVSALRRREGRP
jgi:hypothetical protein